MINYTSFSEDARQERQKSLFGTAVFAADYADDVQRRKREENGRIERFRKISPKSIFLFSIFPSLFKVGNRLMRGEVKKW